MENPVMRRIRADYDDIENNPSGDFMVRKLDWNSYEWQVALRGASNSEFEGGIYHVILKFPNEYPWEEPSFVFLTENGSFSQDTKTNAILNWDPPRMKVQHTLQRLIELMPECPDFESESKSEEHREKRRHLARKSFEAAREYGSSEQQNLIRRIHQYMRNQRREEGVVVDRMVNIGNSSEERILEEYNEIESNPSYDFTCLKRSRDKYKWQYAIRGPRGTEFANGIYHGMVQFSVGGYPLMPPSIIFLTENGCFEIKTRAVLKQRWEPSSSVRNFLIAVIEEMPTYSNGDESRKMAWRRLATDSCAPGAAPKHGSLKRQKLIAEIHERMRNDSSDPELSPDTSQASNGTGGGLVFNTIININCWSTLKSICGNTFVASDATNVGISNAMNDYMITKRFWVPMFIAVLFAGLVIYYE